MLNKMLMKDIEVAAEVPDDALVPVYVPSTNKIVNIQASQLTGSGYAGCRWAKNSSSPEGEPIGNLDKIAQLPDLLGLGCYLVQNDHTRRKLSADNSYLFTDGSAAALDGSMGHYQWGWGRKFFYAHWEDDDYEYEAIDIKPIAGQWNYVIPIATRSAAGYATIDRTNGNLVSYLNEDAQYRGGNNDSTLDGKFNSQLGMGVTMMTVENMVKAAKLNGSMWTANAYMMFFITGAIKRIIFHNKNIQASFNSTLTADGLRQGGTGTGADYPSDWVDTWLYYPYIKLSEGADKGDFTGIFSTTITGSDGNSLTIGNIPSFYGLKNDYKYASPIESMAILSENEDHSQSVYIKDVWDDNDYTISDLTSLKCIGATPSNSLSEGAWDYSKKQNRQNLIMFPTEIGATSSTYDCDGYYQQTGTSGLRVLRVLGNADNGARAGSCFLAGSNGVGASSALCPAVLCEATEAWDSNPVMY